jgi:hypothetical protein
MPRASTLLALAPLALVAANASGSLTLLNAPPPASSSGNLVTNGSFEQGAPAIAGNKFYWATGTTLTSFPFAAPGGWQSAGTAATYASWGRDGPFNSIQLSDNLPDGQNAVYFGNAGTTIDQPATFNPDGTVSFPASPTFTPQYGGPCRLWQSVPTHLTPAPSYRLSFWASGEAARFAAYPSDGVFGLRVTNVLPGDPIQYLAAPGGQSTLGASHRFDFDMVPLNPLLPITVEFINWGHLNIAGNEVGTELVIDDVIVNAAIPAPSAAALPVLALALSTRRRRAQSRG